VNEPIKRSLFSKKLGQIMLLWFRNDLRTHDNPALHHFFARTDKNTERKALFFICDNVWKNHDWSAIKYQFTAC
jgi:deoxyribodipyrimidine photo-lyase